MASACKMTKTLARPSKGRCTSCTLSSRIWPMRISGPSGRTTSTSGWIPCRTRSHASHSPAAATRTDQSGGELQGHVTLANTNRAGEEIGVLSVTRQCATKDGHGQILAYGVVKDPHGASVSGGEDSELLFHHHPDPLMDLLRRAFRFHCMDAMTMVGSQPAVSLIHPPEELHTLSFQPIRRPLAGALSPHILIPHQKQGQIREERVRSPHVQGDQVFHNQSSSIALIRQRRVKVTITKDNPALLQAGPDDLFHQLGPGSGVEKCFSPRKHPPVTHIQKRHPHGLPQFRAAGFSSLQDIIAPSSERTGQKLHLGGLAHAVQPLKGDQDSLIGTPHSV